MELLEGRVKRYEWGSTSVIPRFLGLPEDGRPWAELWFGAHPSAPARVGSGRVPLDAVVISDPLSALGEQVVQRFGSLPFLMKVLAASAPLSLQVHPSTAQARVGFDREESAGVPLDAPHRSYRDRSHKPELICALTDFEALCGFRPPAETLDLLSSIATSALDPVRRRLEAQPDERGLSSLLRYLMTLSRGDAAEMVTLTVEACRDQDEQVDALVNTVDLASRYPGDVGVIISLLLNPVSLRRGEALFLDAGVLHIYMRGVGVEVMANSDNVLRGGLTTKHIDIDAFLETVDSCPSEPQVQRPRTVEGVARYETPVSEFSLTRFEVDGRLIAETGPAVMLCTEGTVQIREQTLERGSAAWITASDGPVEMVGRATLYRAGVGENS